MRYIKALAIAFVSSLTVSALLAALISGIAPHDSFITGFAFVLGSIGIILVPLSMLLAVVIAFLGRKNTQVYE